MNTVFVSILTSLLVSLITFTLGMKSGKNQADRQRLKELYKNITVHFQNLKKGLESHTPKTWRSFSDKTGNSDPLVKRMIKNGDIIEINGKISKRAEETEKQALALGWRFYDIYKDLHAISIETIKKHATIHHEPTGNNYCTKKSESKIGRPYWQCGFGILLDKKLIDEKISYLNNSPNNGFNFEHTENGRILYSVTIYPDDLTDISIKDLLYEINSTSIEKIENASSLLKQKEEICKDINKIIKKSMRRARDPHTFIETIGGAFLDIFKI